MLAASLSALTQCGHGLDRVGTAIGNVGRARQTIGLIQSQRITSVL